MSKWYPSESKGLRSEERRRSNGLENRGSVGARGGGSGRRWNTNMRIKAVEGIKAYNRSADLSGLRLPERLSVYSIVLRVIRTCVRQRISAVDIELPSVVSSAKFLKFQQKD